MEKKKRIKILIIVLVVIMMIGLLVGGILLYLNKSNNENTNNDNNTNNTGNVVDNGNITNKDNNGNIKVNEKVSYKEEGNILKFYDESIELNQYQCEKSNCGTNERYNEYTKKIDNNIVIIYDGALDDDNRKIVFFDVSKGVLNTYTGYSKVQVLDIGIGKYIYLMSRDNKKKLIVDYMGNIIKEGKNYKISCYEGCYLALNSYNIEKDYIITVKDNKYGIEKINSDEVLLDSLYEDVSWSDMNAFLANNKTDNENDGEKYYLEKNYVKVKENNKWYLYDLNNKKKVINTGYEELILIDDETIMVYDNKEIYFINYEGNKIDDNVIKTNGISPAFAKPTFKEKFSIYLKDKIVDFRICDGKAEFWSDCNSKNLIKEYKYDIKNKKVELVK